MERKSDETQGKRECYLPHKAVIRETALSTKMSIVFDASVKASEGSPSLIDCLKTGPPLQNVLWSVLVRNRLKQVAWEADRGALWFHWIKDKYSSQTETLRFTRALLGLLQSPFLLAGTLKQHLETLRTEYPKHVEEIIMTPSLGKIRLINCMSWKSCNTGF